MNLIRASEKGDLSSVKKLIGETADLNAINSSGRTALFEAAWGGHTDIVKLLIEKGANVNSVDNAGYTAVMRAAEEGHDSTVKILLEKGADVNIRGKVRGTTALMLASEQGHLKVIEILIEHGAKINAIDQYEETALARAYRTSQTKAAELLESNGGRGKPERNTFTYNDKDLRPVTKASVPQWSAAANEAIDDDFVGTAGADEGFDEE
jgi:serine/threonine-protein phosphatase 6 regulatory ankyrin repeat subunit B